MSVQSITSLGRVGRILAGSIDPSSISIDREYFANTTSNNQQLQQQQQQHLQQQLQLQQQHYLQQLQTSSTVAGASTNAFNNIKLSSVPPSLTESNSSKSMQQSAAGISSMGDVKQVPFEIQVVLQEPDVIASTKLAHSKTTDSITASGPIAPPRRKKKDSKKGSTSSSEQFYMNEGMRLPAADTDTDSDTKSIKSVRDVQQKLSDDLVKEIEQSWNETSSLQNARMTRCSLDGGGNSVSTANTVMSLGGFSSISALGGNVPAASFSVHASSNTIVSATGTSMSQMSISKTRPVTTAAIGGSINRMSHSLGNSSTSVYSKPSPSNSAKSNSAPGRVRYTLKKL